MRHDHDVFFDIHTQSNRMACNCFCPDCYSEEERTRVGKGCMCPDCICQETGVRKLAAQYYREEVDKQPQGIRLNGRTRPVEDVPLPSESVKTGTCKQCGNDTFRKGSRGRFPTLCETCKNK